MRFLLTSSGISNPSISDALVDLLGKPIAESSALFIPTAIYPFPGGAGMAWQAICGRAQSPLCELGWKSHLVGHASTVVTKKVYRKELRPVLTRGAEAMDTVFEIKVKDQPVDRQLARQVPDTDESSNEDDEEEGA